MVLPSVSKTLSALLTIFHLKAIIMTSPHKKGLKHLFFNVLFCLRFFRAELTLTDTVPASHNPEYYHSTPLEQFNIISTKHTGPSHSSLSFCSQRTLGFSGHKSQALALAWPWSKTWSQAAHLCSKVQHRTEAWRYRSPSKFW